jgi:hypothetical protein
MATWFYRGLRKGIATTRYPPTVDPWTADLPTPPAFDPGRLSVAVVERLAAACPSGAIARERSELVIDLGRCTGCGACGEAGGDAVVPSGEFLLATRERAALVKRVPLLGADPEPDEPA